MATPKAVRCRFTPEWGTVPEVISGMLHWNVGPTPSIVEMEIASQTSYMLSSTNNGTKAANGSIEFNDWTTNGTSGGITLASCRVLSVSNEHSKDGFKTTMRVADRRWKWAGAPTETSEWNIRDNGGKITETGYTKKTAAALAAYLLDKLGETGYTIGLPSDSSDASAPYVKWENQNPAQALSDLCDLYGYVIALDSTSPNAVRICQIGTATATQPASAKNRARQESDTNYIPVPSHIRIVGAPNRWEVTLNPLNGVTLEPGGKIEQWSVGTTLSHANGTYQPEWDVELSSRAAEATGTNKDVWELYADNCKRSFMHWWQPVDTVTIYPGGAGTSLVRQVYMRSWKAETNSYGTSDTELKFQKAYIYGTFLDMDNSQEDPDEDDEESGMSQSKRLKSSFHLDSVRGLVITDKQIYDLTAAGNIMQPSLYLRCVVEHDPSVYVQASGLSGTDGSFFVSEYHPDFQYHYDVDSLACRNGTATNAAYMNALAASYADDIKTRLADQIIEADGDTRSYGGIHRFQLDGIYREITWSAGVDQAPLTVVSRSQQHSYGNDTIARNHQRRTAMAWRKQQDSIMRTFREMNEYPREESF